MGGQSVSCLHRIPVLVGLGEPGLTPLDLPGRAFRVRRAWRQGLRSCLFGRLGVFVSVTYYHDADWETCLRFSRGRGFYQQEDLFQVLACVELSRFVWRSAKP
jgi:hypothetical protein